jgi:LysR family transcriptional regulator (chromosome initiation inhibitor)
MANVTVDLAQLQALAAAVDGGTFDAAARRLHVTPSAISQRIRALENSVGSVLLTRSRPVRATDAGTTYLSLARRIDALMADAEAADLDDSVQSVPLAVNGDSLATWVLPALAPLADRIRFTLHREDQDHSTALLRDGTVMAAITTEATPVQGCTARALGTMSYRLLAAPAFAGRWFPAGVDAAAVARAPVVVFDVKDDLQHRYVRDRWGTTIDAQPHYVPSSADFVAAVAQGFGWATVPDLQSAPLIASGALVELDPGHHLDVELHWQQWALSTTALDRTAEAIAEAAALALR